MLENKLGITNEVELAKEEERITKLKALELFDTNKINEFEVGTLKGLSSIHNFLFSEVYDFAGKMRNVNIAKGNFRFAPVMYLEEVLKKIDEMPQSNFDFKSSNSNRAYGSKPLSVLSDKSPLLNSDDSS